METGNIYMFLCCVHQQLQCNIFVLLDSVVVTDILVVQYSNILILFYKHNHLI